jgi:hypothetical protein
LSIAICYPVHPNDVTKKKYYELIHNFPLFMPDSRIGNKFSDLIDKYPITPYLDSRDSFIKWVHFIHNRVNKMTNKAEISLKQALKEYYYHYKPKAVKMEEELKYRQKLVFFLILLGGVVGVYYLYKK